MLHISFLRVVFFGVLLVFGGAAHGANAPNVWWGPSTPIILTVDPGVSAVVERSLRIRKGLPPARIRILPIGVQTLIAERIKLPDTSKFKSSLVRLRAFAPPGTPPGPITGVIEVRESLPRGKFGKRLTKPLPFTLIVRESNVVAGVDNNANQVWDYLDQAIDVSSPQPEVRGGLRQYARGLQGALLDATDRTASLRHRADIGRATECLLGLNSATANDTLADFTGLALNNRARSESFIQFSDQVGGQIALRARPDQRIASCVGG